ncbi:MAG: hypothetical protein OXM02_02860 [Bacteroidota bacterium]|nr:hypothetical protein [Bacteroidota bacterium]MDE2833441.1 hypothetical protein [Bacteroidota bacterium]MDE2958390.1 hypothetical protein [Bacteroidota bacterium]
MEWIIVIGMLVVFGILNHFLQRGPIAKMSPVARLALRLAGGAGLLTLFLTSSEAQAIRVPILMPLAILIAWMVQDSIRQYRSAGVEGSHRHAAA